MDLRDAIKELEPRRLPDFSPQFSIEQREEKVD
jgi:hypothetical protein